MLLGKGFIFPVAGALLCDTWGLLHGQWSFAESLTECLQVL